MLHKRAPQMPIEVEENLTENLDALLRNGRLDVAIIALPFEVPGVITLPLYDEPFSVVVPKTHAWAKRSAIRADELSADKVLLLSSGHCFSNQVVEACPELQRRGGKPLLGRVLAEHLENYAAIKNWWGEIAA